ncbi:lysophospholipid acyltransferase family protein [Amaricoccus tamworthensis]|uniref:lysophospholipid acyltransferase family protein n=1 Tax=Amaricoccus tamworthensis TaxID=57002 RepID=UPI003C7AEA46
MKVDRNLARDISYASAVGSRTGRAVIRSLENLTGRLKLIKMAQDYELEMAKGRDFWEIIPERYGLSLNVQRGSLANIPRTGPLVVISNHPYGILDGLMLGNMLSQTRGDFRVIAHHVFRKASELNRVILPIAFDNSKESREINLATRKQALRFLAEGGCMGIFPGGTVSTALKPFGQPADPEWRRFTARMIVKSNATVVPIFFAGHNSRLFQVASHISVTLRLALLINEFRGRVGGPVDVAIGEPILPDDMAPYSGDAAKLIDHLRTKTYDLDPTASGQHHYGYDWETAV